MNIGKITDIRAHGNERPLSTLSVACDPCVAPPLNFSSQELEHQSAATAFL